MNAGKKQFANYNSILPLVILIVALLFGLKSAVYSIGPDEVGVVQRFGKYVDTTIPGLHFKLPFGIEKVTPLKVKRIFKEEFGMRTAKAGVRTRYARGDYSQESHILSGDLNIVAVRWILHFRIKDPVKLLFRTRNPIAILRDISEVVMRRLAGDYRVDEVLTT